MLLKLYIIYNQIYMAKLKFATKILNGVVMVNYIKSLEIPYWFNRHLLFQLYWRDNKLLVLTIWQFHRLTNIGGYENEWGTNWWKHITLWIRKE